MEAEIGRTFSGRPEAAYAWIEHHLKPRMEERWHTLRRKASGKLPPPCPPPEHPRLGTVATALRDGPAPFEGWAKEAAAFLSLRGMTESQPSPPPALPVLRPKPFCLPAAPWTYARAAWNIYMRKAGTGAARCLYGSGGAMIYLRAALAGTAVHTLRGKWCPQAYADLMKSSGADGPPWSPRR
ncbi:MAG: hypothetical protein ACLT38_09120 [Akkermansia sp.]